MSRIHHIRKIRAAELVLALCLASIIPPTLATADERDTYLSINGGGLWYADCDGDAFFGDVAGIDAPDEASALANDTFCAGNDNFNLPYEVTLTPPEPSDCDDFNNNVYPGKLLTPDDVNDGLDNDCSLGVDSDECFLDSDDDGFGGLAGIIIDSTDLSCNDIQNDGILESTEASDCDDANPDVYPDKVLTPGDVNDGLDNDCSLGVGSDECFLDSDDDGFGGLAGIIIDSADLSCNDIQNDGILESTAATDCNDSDATGWMLEDWYPDCDDDDVYDSSATNACAVSGANDAFNCVGGSNPPNDDWSTVQGTDCNDEDATAISFENWYPDCDDDGVHSPTATFACGISGANSAFDCANGMDPPGTGPDQWVTTPGTDCDDENPAVNAEQSWYADCDGDGILGGVDGIVACTEADAEADTEFCGNGTSPFSVSTTPPPEPDCDDSDPTGFAVEDWYPDCDGDGVNSSIATSACGVVGANAVFDCESGGDPLGDWSTVQGTDCDDEDVDAANPNKPWWADCDGDTAFQAEAGIFECTMTDAQADDMECAGNDNGNLPFNVSPVPPLDPDCDDFDATVQDLDCSGVCGGDDISCLPFYENGFELSWIQGRGCSTDFGGLDDILN